jgi:hypothetical protein
LRQPIDRSVNTRASWNRSATQQIVLKAKARILAIQARPQCSITLKVLQ